MAKSALEDTFKRLISRIHTIHPGLILPVVGL
jgi:hypothetical protein